MFLSIEYNVSTLFYRPTHKRENWLLMERLNIDEPKQIISRVYPDPYTSLNTKCRYRQTFESVVVQLSVSIVRELYDGSGCWSCQTPQKAHFNRL